VKSSGQAEKKNARADGKGGERGGKGRIMGGGRTSERRRSERVYKKKVGS